MDAESCWRLFQETGAPEWFVLYQQLRNGETVG